MNSLHTIVALVDDDTIFQMTASRLIKGAQSSTKILQFNNGEEALQYLKENAKNFSELPDILFLDINMPFVDGWMFLDEFVDVKSELSKNFKIYMVSSSINPTDINRARDNHNVTDYLIKPVTKEKFVELISFAKQA
jgi:two-component system, chemotaxis family, chemotaxis protein CheY